MVRRLSSLVTIAALTVACDVRPVGIVGVTPPATRIAFVSQPSSAQAGVAITPAVQVVVQNNDGTTVPSANVPISLSIVPGTGTAGAVLTGGAAQQATQGVVNFTNLRIDLPGTGYQLQATASGFASVTSAPFNITP